MIDYCVSLPLRALIWIHISKNMKKGYFKLKRGAKSFIYSGLLFLVISAAANAQEIGKPLPSWEEGMLDLHHINTGRGDAAFFILPDASTILVDAGEMSDDNPRTLSERNTPRYPNNNKLPFEWIADYIRQFGPAKLNTEIDYAIITHFHGDHFGQINSYSPFEKAGAYQQVGIAGLGTILKFKKLIAREHPSMSEGGPKNSASTQNTGTPIAEPNSSIKNLITFLKYQKEKSGLNFEKMLPGKLNQISLKEQVKYPGFNIRNIYSNGIAWTGEDDNTFDLMARGENDLSLGFRITYGTFDYFTGGDISGVSSFGESLLNSVEANVAPAIGPVDVATLNHHGNRDSQNTFYVRTIRPRVWIGQTWSSDHPGDDVLRRITSKELYPGERDLFATSMLKANKMVIGEMIDQVYGSQQGHILIRVAKGGASYQVIILEDSDEERKVKAVFGPYKSR